MVDTQRLLIVEDDPSTRLVLVVTLENLGFNCDSVGSAEDALDILSWEHFDALLIDKNLPGMDGVTCVERIRRFEETMTIVMITADPTLASAVDTLHLGIDGYQEKPIEDVGAFVDRLRHLIAARRRNAQSMLRNTVTRPQTDTIEAWRQLEVLIACPEAADRDWLQSYFEGLGDEVAAVPSSADILPWVRRYAPDLVLVDAQLDVPPVLEQLQAEEHPTAAVLVTDEEVAMGDVIELIDLSVRAIVARPFSPSSIEAPMRDLLYQLRLTHAEPIDTPASVSAPDRSSGSVGQE